MEIFETRTSDKQSQMLSTPFEMNVQRLPDAIIEWRSTARIETAILDSILREGDWVESVKDGNCPTFTLTPENLKILNR